MTDRIPFNEFSNDLEVMPSSDTMYYNVLKIEQEKKSKWKEDFEAYLQRLESLKKGK